MTLYTAHMLAHIKLNLTEGPFQMNISTNSHMQGNQKLIEVRFLYLIISNVYTSTIITVRWQNYHTRQSNKPDEALWLSQEGTTNSQTEQTPCQ